MKTASARETQKLLKLYDGCSAFCGELHNHAATGGTSDGKYTLTQWREALQQLHLDFAAILDHRQVRHMFLPEWEDGLFICGTEPGTVIVDSTGSKPTAHYNMIFASPEPLMALLEEFPEFEYEGGVEGHFGYPSFTTERFGQLIDAVKAHGGFFVRPHPKQNGKYDDPLCYWFRDETGLEVFYHGAERDNDFVRHTQDNYRLWVDLLQRGKRLWACAGGDEHAAPTTLALTTIYATEKSNEAYLSQLRKGNFVCGSVGIRMCVGETTMGGVTDFTGKRLIICVSDFHESVRRENHLYRLDIINENGVVCSEEIGCDGSYCFSMPTQQCGFYRAEVLDVTAQRRIAIGNPIWNGI